MGFNRISLAKRGQQLSILIYYFMITFFIKFSPVIKDRNNYRQNFPKKEMSLASVNKYKYPFQKIFYLKERTRNGKKSKFAIRNAF